MELKLQNYLKNIMLVGLILTACLTAGRNKDDDDIDQYP